MRLMHAMGSDMTLEQARDAMNTLVRQGSTAAHQIGTIYNHVVNRKLAELAGYKSAQDFFTQQVKALSQATLSTYGAVARTFPEAVCTQYGVYHLRALMRYVEVTGDVLNSDPGTLGIDVPQEDGKVLRKPFSDCSVDEMERALRAKKAPTPVRVPVPDQARLLFFEDSIFRNFSGVAEVRFTSNRQDEKTLLNVQGVPMSEVPRLIQALQQGLEAQPSLAAK
ncbi:MAG TPA: hypothetical protein VF794_30225 [Archangium sp.]|jgi:hypothetical protein|uniref:hypothetical protein n=1 Tax=Archangium sp. TaxID=1872627 RepID=UPI002EDAAE97